MNGTAVHELIDRANLGREAIPRTPDLAAATARPEPPEPSPLQLLDAANGLSMFLERFLGVTSGSHVAPMFARLFDFEDMGKLGGFDADQTCLLQEATGGTQPVLVFADGTILTKRDGRASWELTSLDDRCPRCDRPMFAVSDDERAARSGYCSATCQRGRTTARERSAIGSYLHNIWFEVYAGKQGEQRRARPGHEDEVQDRQAVHRFPGVDWALTQRVQATLPETVGVVALMDDVLLFQFGAEPWREVHVGRQSRAVRSGCRPSATTAPNGARVGGAAA